MIYKKKTAQFVTESYAVQKQREEVVGRLHIFLADYFRPKIQISFVNVAEILMYLILMIILNHLPFQSGIDASVISIFITDTSDCRPKFIYEIII